MNRYMVLLRSVVVVSSIIWMFCIHGDSWQYKSAKSYLRTRNLEENVAAQFFIWGDIVADKSGTSRGALQLLPLYQKSQADSGVAGYFLLDCAPAVLVAGDSSPQKLDRSVRAEWLGLPANFVGYFGVKPEQRQIGGLVTYNQDIAQLGFAWLDRIWLVASTAIVSVRNALNPFQYRVEHAVQGGYTPAGTFAPGNLLQAFNNPDYQAGRMTNCDLTHTGLSEVSIGFGTEWAHENGFLLWYQTTLDIPAAGKTDTEYLFSPNVGTNGHVGWSNTVALALPMQPDEACYAVRLIGTIANHYYFPHNQWRIFDLYKKPWSRYMLYRSKNNPDLVIPGLNLLTQQVRVHPHNYLNLSAGVRLEYAGWECEIGYQLWAHNAERLQFLTPSCSTMRPRIEDFGIAFPGGGTASESTISSLQAVADPTFVHLYQNDIDRNSGAAQNARSQAMHAEIGYRGSWGYGACGVFVERPKVNTSLAQWGVWGACALEF